MKVYADYLSKIMMRLPGCGRGLILNELRQSGRRFCERSAAWRPVFKLDTVAGQAAYEIPLPANTELDRVLSVRLFGVELVESEYDLIIPDLLISDPQNSVDADAVLEVTGDGLIDGVSPNGYYRVKEELDSFVVYEGLSTPFELLSSLSADRCDLIYKPGGDRWAFSQTGSDPVGNYEASGVATGSALVARVAPVAVNPSVEVLNPPLQAGVGAVEIQCVLLPTEDGSVGLPQEFMKLYANGIVAGAMAELFDYPQPWGNPRKVKKEKSEFNRFVGRGRKANATGRSGRPQFSV